MNNYKAKRGFARRLKDLIEEIETKTSLQKSLSILVLDGYDDNMMGKVCPNGMKFALDEVTTKLDILWEEFEEITVKNN